MQNSTQTGSENLVDESGTDKVLELLDKKKVIPIEWGPELMARDIPPVEWYYEDYLPKGRLVYFAGHGASYKTFFALWMCYRLSAGLPLFDYAPDIDTFHTVAKPSPARILFVEEETPDSDIKERLKLFTQNPDDLKNLAFTFASDLNLSVDGDLDVLEKIIVDNKIDVVVLDPFSSVMAVANENDNSEIASKLKVIQRRFILNPDLRTTFVFIHHLTKASRGDKENFSLRGAGDIGTKADLIIGFKKHADYAIAEVFPVKARCKDQAKIPDAEIELHFFTEDWSDGTPHADFQLKSLSTLDDKMEALDQEIEDLGVAIVKEMQPAGELWTRGQVATAVGTKSAAHKFSKAWKNLVDRDEIVKSKRKFTLNK